MAYWHGNEIIYPTVEDIITTNKRILNYKKITKAEGHKLLCSRAILSNIIIEVKKFEGDIKHKAALLLLRINQSHCFASANKRTSLAIAYEFMATNNIVPTVRNESDSIFLLEVREGKHTIEEIARWL